MAEVAMKTYIAIYAIPELLIIFIGVAFIVWLMWRAWEDSRKAALDQAWHEVLDEVYYTEQQHFAERKRVEDEHKRAAAAKC
jgi:ABC-type nickel/cobalt efflux system permease component RcnA